MCARKKIAWRGQSEFSKGSSRLRNVRGFYCGDPDSVFGFSPTKPKFEKIFSDNRIRGGTSIREKYLLFWTRRRAGIPRKFFQICPESTGCHDMPGVHLQKMICSFRTARPANPHTLDCTEGRRISASSRTPPVCRSCIPA